MVASLADMRPRQHGQVVEIQGGQALRTRLHAMGIYPGVRIVRKNAQPWRGPVVLEAAGSRLAIGFGMAQKIMVEIPS